MAYLFGWAVVYLSFLFQGLTHYRGRFFLVSAIFFLAATAFFRGSVGTDTANYEVMLFSFGSDYSWDGREPGFVALAWSLQALLPSAEFAVRAISLVFFSFLLIYCSRGDRNELFFVLVYFLPAFAYQYGMNALRIGLASAIILLVVQRFRRLKSVSSLNIGFLSVLFHYSAIFSTIYVLASQQQWFTRKFIFLVAFFLLAISAGVVVADAYFMDKLSIYTSMAAPGPLSGISKIIPALLVLVGVCAGCLPSSEKVKLVALGIFCVVMGWAITQYSYAGLRLLDLVALSLPLSVLASYSRLDLAFDLPLRVGFLFAGLVSVAAVYRGFLLEYGQGPSPFLPFELYDVNIFISQNRK